MEAGQSLRALPLHPEGLALIGWLEGRVMACGLAVFVFEARLGTRSMTKSCSDRLTTLRVLAPG